MKQKISVVINTLNEEQNLPYALRSVRDWVDEIVVVDMYSDDQTVEVAKKYGAKVFQHERILAFDAARKFAVEQATNEWVLILDADEVVPTELSKLLFDIANTDRADAVTIPRLNYLLGDVIMHTGWGPEEDRHLRFFKRDSIVHSPRIHAFISPAEGARVIDLAYLPNRAIMHFNYINSEHFISKLNRYTSVEARQAYERGETSSISLMFVSATKEFLSRYLKHKGFLDGWRGLYLSLFMVFYRISIYAKIKEISDIGEDKEIVNRYHNIAESVVNAYELQQ